MIVLAPKRPSALRALAASAAFLVAAGASAHVSTWAQTVVNAAPVDPLVNSLRDRVDSLESQIRKLTGDNERLQFELRQAKDDNTRLQRTIDDMNAQASLGAGAPAQRGQAVSSAPPSSTLTVPRTGGDPAAEFTAAYALVAKGDHPAAQAAFASFLQAYPTDPRAPNAHYWLGQAMLAQGASADAATQFLSIVKSTPKAELAPDAMVRLGVALNRMGEKAQACGTLTALPTQYPKASAATKAAAQAQIKAIGC
jgi:tol-pal system protein YbgF